MFDLEKINTKKALGDKLQSIIAEFEYENNDLAFDTACNIFKKHSIEMLSIITNKTVKELNREKLVYNLNQNKLNKTSKYILERRG